jgi:hypothetical protein
MQADEVASAGQPELPPAPAWTTEPAQVEPEPEPEPGPPPPPPAMPPPAQGTGEHADRRPDLPINWPTMLSGWLIGGGSLLGVLSLIPSLGSVLSLLLFLALLGVALTVFLAERMPDVPRQRLAILVVSMIGLGVGLARAGFTVQGPDTLFLVAMLATAGGALLIELDRDRPMPPAERTG